MTGMRFVARDREEADTSDYRIGATEYEQGHIVLDSHQR